MHIVKLLVPASALLLGSWIQGASAVPIDEITALGGDLLTDLRSHAIEALGLAEGDKVNKRGKCTLATASVRKDWARLSSREKKDYIRAVQCLQKKPSKSDPSFAPGARSRYDDFVAIHIDQTFSIHATGNFLTWHRYFVHAYETALKKECGYKGAHPYWNWFKHQDDPTKSPVFDGSDTSISGDGSFVPHNGSFAGANQIFLPPGNGGGCVTSGPFKDMVVNMGPVMPIMSTIPVNPNGPMGYNPRCLSRDLSAYPASNWLNYENLFNVTLGRASENIVTFQDEFQGRFDDGFLGLHSAGHFVVNGDAGDFFASPVDPAFFLHHTMVDYVYWLWQALHPNQALTVGGTITFFNMPPSRDTSVDDLIVMGVNGPDLPIRDLLSTVSGEPLCYIYL